MSRALPDPATKGIDVDQLLAYGEQQVGKPYVFGTAGPNTFDCSGLISYMYKRFGIDLPHHAATQATYGDPVDKGSIARGDLVFSDWGDGPNSHVGIATDSSHILVAPHTGTDVQVEPLNAGYLSHVTAVRRVGDLVDNNAPIPAGTGGTSSSGGITGIASSASTSLQSLWSGALTGADQVVTSFTGPFREIAKPLQDIGSGAVEIAAIGDRAMSLFLPSNFTRVVAGGAGMILILLGLFFLSREIRN